MKKTIGAILLFLGIGIGWIAFNTKITVESSNNNDVYNIGLLNDKICRLIIAQTFFISGIVFLLSEENKNQNELNNQEKSETKEKSNAFESNGENIYER